MELRLQFKTRMAIPGRLTNPPIKEALVDFRTERAIPLDPQELQSLWPQVKERFPHLEIRNKLQARIAARLGQPPDAKAEDLGFYGLFLGPKDKSTLAQFRVDGFTFSRLSAYTSADELFAEALELWQRFIALSRPDRVTRVAVRYINRLVLPFHAGDDLSRFLRASIELPAEVPQAVGDLLTRVALPIGEDGTTNAIVTQRLEPPTNADEAPFLLDVDVYRTGDTPLDPESLSATLQQLREIKNQLFFAFVTDEALEAYR
jgi:uncharacterized protein (TIGR04255 family)